MNKQINILDIKLGFTQQIRGQQIPILFYNHIPQQLIAKLRQCKKFKDFITKMRNSKSNVQLDIKVQRIQISCIFTFSKNTIGFVTLKVITKQNGHQIDQENSYVFMRGDSVAILLFVNDKLAVVEQYRVPAQQTFIEPPAGMIDQSGNLSSKVIQQTFQQTGIKIKKQMLKYMGSVVPNPSICDQQIFLYYCKISLSQQKMKQLQSKQHGEKNSQEKIRLKFIDYDPLFILKTGNGAFIEMACLYQYQYHKFA